MFHKHNETTYSTSNKFVVWEPVLDLLTMFVYTKMLEIGFDISRSKLNEGLVTRAFNDFVSFFSASQ